MKFIYLLWLFLGVCGIAQAQTITVKNQETNEPIEFATLYNEDTKVFIVTNSLGEADISALRDADKIEIRSLGYKTLVISFAQLQSESFKIFLATSNLNLEEVVVSGTRWRQTTNEIPSKIFLISPTEVAFQNPQTAADLLNITGKVYVQKSQQGGGSPMIRGFATNRLLYTVDGVRMNTAIFRAGNIQNVISIDPFATENAEVLFGPG